MIDASFSRQRHREDLAARARRRRLLIPMVAAFMISGGGLSLVWGFGGTAALVPSSDVAPSPARKAVSNEILEAAKGLQSTQQQAVDQLQVVQDQLVAQKEETKKLSEQIAAVTEKLGHSLQNRLPTPHRPQLTRRLPHKRLNRANAADSRKPAGKSGFFRCLPPGRSALTQPTTSGKFRVYGKSVALDYRQVVAFIRKIRAVDSDGAHEHVAPIRIANFPPDLRNPDLQFSGIYEDGWIGDRGFVTLSSAAPGKAIIRGTVPGGIGIESVELTMTAGSSPPVTKLLKPGSFEIEAPVGAGENRINFQFSGIGRLPAPDNRPAAAVLSSISIESNDPRSLADPIPKVLAGVATKSNGIFWDGWAAPSGLINVDVKAPATLRLQGIVSGIEGQQITIGGDVSTAVQKDLPDGPFQVEVPIAPGRSEVSFVFSRHMHLPSDHGRTVSALILSASVEGDDRLAIVRSVGRLISAARSWF